MEGEIFFFETALAPRLKDEGLKLEITIESCFGFYLQICLEKNIYALYQNTYHKTIFFQFYF